MKKDNSVTIIDMGKKPTKEDKKILKELKKETKQILSSKDLTIVKF